MKISRNWSQAGFSIIQGMMMAAGLAGMALVGTQLITQEKDALKDIETRDNIEQINTMIFSILQNRDHCLATFVSNGNSHINLAPNQTKNFTTINLQNGGSPAFTVGTRYLNNSVLLNGMRLQLPADLSQPGTLTLDYVRQEGTRKGIGGENIRKVMGIVLQRSTPTNLTACSSTLADNSGVATNETLTQEVCDDFDLMVWDPVLRTCKLKDNICAPPLVFVGIDPTGEKICRDFKSFIPEIIANTVDDCPGDFDTVKFTRQLNNPGQASRVLIECNKTNETCPSSYQRGWNIPPSYCNGNLPRGDNGEVFTASDFTNPSTGSATYKCQNGSWLLQAGHTCIAPCAAVLTQNWSVSSKTCTSSLPYTQNGVSVDLTDSTPTTTGTATYTCTNGTWAVQAGATCVKPCVAGDVTWNVDDDYCKDSLPASADGAVVNVKDVEAILTPAKGGAKYKCNAGNWQLVSGSQTCDTGSFNGLCKWTEQTTWPEPNCEGFQDPPEAVSGSREVKSAAKCAAICKKCDVTTTYGGCTYTKY